MHAQLLQVKDTPGFILNIKFYHIADQVCSGKTPAFYPARQIKIRTDSFIAL
jgi:hypothetical protein